MRRLAAALAGIRIAPLFETEPVSGIAQPPFLNTAVIGLTRLAPADLLAVTKAIELAAGRRRGERWGPRPLDIDVLLYGEAATPAPELTLPHPRLRERLFVLAPLAEIAPDWRVPPGNETVSELREALPQDGILHRREWDPLRIEAAPLAPPD